jgi:hypothetical protein
VNWEQLKAILWLRWRLSRNQFARGGPLNAVLSVLFKVMLAMGALSLGAGGLVGGWFAGAKASPLVLLAVWDAVVFAFLLLWATGLMVEIQRSESIDLPKLLHLPVTLQQVFVFNYVVSLLAPSIVLFLPGMLGLCVGLTLGGGPVLALMGPLMLGFVFAVTAWTYCLRGWLAALMMNKRRRRAIIVWVTVIFVAVCQIPNLVFTSPRFYLKLHPPPSNRPARAQPAGNGQEGLPQVVLDAHIALPPGWLGYGAMTLKQHNPWPALGATALGWLIGMLGLRQAYRLTLRFYQGQEGRARPAPVSRPARQGPARPSKPLLVERRLPGLPDDLAALTLALFRCLTRAPELKMALIMPVVMGAVAASMFFTRPAGSIPHVLAGFLATGVAVFAVFSMAPTMANAFGLDRDGFRSLVLLPTQRHHILLAKNLAFFPFVAVVALALLAVAAVVTHMTWDACLTGLVQAPTAFLLFSLLCNVAAVLAPYRMAQGSLQMKKPKPLVFLVMFLNLLLMPVVLPVLLIAPGLQLLFSSLKWAPWLPVNLLAAIATLAGVAWLYRSLLPLQGRLLRRREQAILQEVTQEIE